MNRHASRVPPLCGLAALVLAASAAQGDVASVIGELRSGGCGGGRAGAVERAVPESTLHDAARRLAAGTALPAALEQAGYRAARSSSIEIRGAGDDGAVRAVLERGYCEAVTDPAYTEIGWHEQAGRLDIVLAEPFEPTALDDSQAVQRDVLTLVNAARAERRRCGRRRLGPAPPLTLSPVLTRAAESHAHDLAATEVLDHRGSDGSEPAERVARAGYAWRSVAENVAAGQRTAAAVVADWLSSPGHCTNIMSDAYTEMGLAYVIDAESTGGVYWVQVFAAPR